VVLLAVIGLMAMYLGLQVGAAVIAVVPAALENPGISGDSLVQMMMSDGSGFSLGTSAGWIAVLALFAICPTQSLSLRRWLGLFSTPVLPAIGWTLAGGAILVVAAFGFSQIMDEKSRKAIEMMALGFMTPIPFLFAVVVAAPIVEELIFRGYLFSGWVDKLGLVGTTLASSFLFTIMHCQYGVVALASVFVTGVILSLIRWKTGSLYPCIVLHMLFNLGAMVSLYYSGI
jgi:membrane protease YdiL (CAAX protease family)